MIDLYAAGTSNGLRARIALEECGLAYELHPIDLAKGEHRSAEYLQLNPNGQIPVIVDRDGPGGKPLTLSQSIAILMYCAEKAGRFLPSRDADRPVFWQARASAATDIGGTLTSIFTISRSKEPHAPTQGLFEGRWKQYFKVWNDLLEKRRYCAGEELTVADFALYPVWYRAVATLPALCEGFPAVERWAKEIGARPAVQRAMKF